MKYRPATEHLALGGDFFDPVAAAQFPKHILRFRNQRWATHVGLDPLDDQAWLDHFARFRPLPQNLSQPLALRYHGHQFQHYNPNIGDGRGFLFAQLRDLRNERLLDLGTKGSGQTPWSRDGDGRLTLKGGVREVLATAMLEALGVYTSKSFSLVETGEKLMRGDEPSPTRSSVLVRLSHSHIRFGSFQRQAFLERSDNLQKLVDYSVERYYPQHRNLDPRGRVAALLSETVQASAKLAASWMVAGFVHGVLNTDNLNITGESFDYGPYRFLPTLDPEFTAAYFDHGGLYAYGNQPANVAWNLERLAEALHPIAETDSLVSALHQYEPTFREAFRQRTVQRLGLASLDAERDQALVDEVYRFVHASQIEFERFFFDWYGGSASETRAMSGPAREHYETQQFAAVGTLLRRFRASDTAALDHPYFAGDPCTLLIGEIESIWSYIADNDDWGPFEAKLDAIDEMRDALQGTGL